MCYIDGAVDAADALRMLRHAVGKEVLAANPTHRPFEQLSDYKKLDFFLSRTENYSKIPKRDLNAVQSYFFLKALFRKDYGTKEETQMSYDSTLM